jgi:CHAD domain-containing protein
MTQKAQGGRPEAIKSSLTRYLSDSLVLLGQQPVPGDKAIHDVRVLMKKYRAAVKLVRPLLDENTYQREYKAAREAGRMLRSWRETSVLRKTVKSLKKDNPGLFMKLWDNETIQNLLRKPYTTWQAAGVQALSVTEISTLLNKALFRVRFLSLNNPDVHQLLQQLNENYLVAARAYLDCRNNPKPKLLHEFRKKSKTFLYQLCYFRQFNPQTVRLLEKKLDSLTQNLGRYNAMAQIMGIIGYRYGDPGNTAVTDELAVVIRNRQDSYLIKVWPSAFRIFSPGKTLQDLLGTAF